jgi:outer membrane protein OmpA-like peptidoglycan-associated protein
MNKAALSIVLILLSACTTAPTPPVVDGSDRQPINTGQAIKRIERIKPAPRQERKYAQIAYPPETVKDSGAPIQPNVPQTVWVQFPFKATKFKPSPSQAEEIHELMLKSSQVIVRGRTDGRRYTASDENIALNRALSAKRYLVRNGASPLMIFINYYSGGDYIADNNSPEGRHQNRRVELEFIDYAIQRQPTLPDSRKD